MNINKNNNNGEDLIRDMFSEFEAPTTNADWESMKESLAESSGTFSATQAEAVSDGVGIGKTFLGFMSKGLILSLIGLVAIATVFFLWQNQNDPSSNILSENIESTINNEKEHLSSSESINTENINEGIINQFEKIEINNTEVSSINKKSNPNFSTSSTIRIDNINDTKTQNNTFVKNSKALNRQLNNINLSNQQNVETRNTVDGFENNSNSYISIEHVKNDKYNNSGLTSDFTKNSDVLSDNYITNKIASVENKRKEFQSGLLDNIKGININNEAEFANNLILAKNIKRSRFGKTKNWNTFALLGIRYSAFSHRLLAESDYFDRSLSPYESISVGFLQQYNFNKTFSISTGINYNRILTTSIIHLSEPHITPSPVSDLEWKFRRVVQQIHGLDIPIVLNYDPSSNLKLIDKLSITAGANCLFVPYAKPMDKELTESIGSYKSVAPEGWLAPSNTEGIKPFDFGITMGIAYRFSPDNYYFQLLYNYGFGDIFNDDFFNINPRFDRNVNVQLQLKYKLL